MSSCPTQAETARSAAAGCGCQAPVFDGATPAYRRALALVIAINLIGFAVIAIGSLAAGSAALAANTLDFLADAATYGLSLWAIGRSARVRAGAALLKSASLAAMAAGILGFAVWRAAAGAMPDATAISGLGLFGAAANLAAAFLLVRYREGDANVRSVWLCTRNDVIQCVAVAATGGAVLITGSRWPDLVAGVLLATIFLRSAWQITVQAHRERCAAAAQDVLTASAPSPASV